ncbi:MAG: autoinducer binding domain-containing protein [Pseudoxanthomonas sp.]
MSWREDCLSHLTAAANSVDEIVNQLAIIVGEMGFEYCSYVMRMPVPLAEPAVVWASTYPSEWLDRYFSSNYLEIDPILHRISWDLSPLIWADTGASSEPAFWEEARAHGVRHGWAMATHGRHMTVGMLSLARSTAAVTELELAGNEMKLVWLAHVVHGLISSVELQKVMSETFRELSHREREVLRWSGAGKTADEIASILGITERTVTFHIASTLTKLNVVNKTQAVAKALLLGALT